MVTSRVGFSDFFIVFFYGLALCYTHHFIYPLNLTQQWVASGILALALGTFGPSLEETLEWILAFGLGIAIALLVPQILQFYKTGAYDGRAILETFVHSVPLTLKLLTPWIVSLPVGYLFYKITHRNYYRHARFF